MLLAVNIGNTSTTFGVFAGERLATRFRLRSEQRRSEGEWAALFLSLLWEQGIASRDISGIILSSVVPPITSLVSEMLERHLEKDPIIITPHSDLGLTLKYNPTDTLGSDRLVNAFAVRELYLRSGNYDHAIVVDGGTATTMEAVSTDGTHHGGVILPGIGLSCDALFERASQLASVELRMPEKVIGTNTGECLRSGILNGFAAQIGGLIVRIREELSASDPDRVIIVGTGGALPRISEYLTPRLNEFNKNLGLEGLRLAYKRLNPTLVETDEAVV
jgi:type III pantothenate kinase